MRLAPLLLSWLVGMDLRAGSTGPASPALPVARTAPPEVEPRRGAPVLHAAQNTGPDLLEHGTQTLEGLERSPDMRTYFGISVAILALATWAITSGNWLDAMQTDGEPLPASQGTLQSMTVNRSECRNAILLRVEGTRRMGQRTAVQRRLVHHVWAMHQQLLQAIRRSVQALHFDGLWFLQLLQLFVRNRRVVRRS